MKLKTKNQNTAKCPTATKTCKTSSYASTLASKLSHLNKTLGYGKKVFSKN